MTKIKKWKVFILNIIFVCLQNAVVEAWLYENSKTVFRGRLIGIDEYFNIVLDGANEVNLATGAATPLGRMMLKGDSMALLCLAPQ